MKLSLTLSSLLVLFVCVIGSVPGHGQGKSIPSFLKEKQIWEEKLVVLYASEALQPLLKEQLNALYPYMNAFKKEKIVVVQIPPVLSGSNREYLKQKLHVQKDRLNVWVIDERGKLRMTSTKLTSPEQLLRVLNIDFRPDAVARAQFMWE